MTISDVVDPAASAVLDRLLRDNPKFHYISETRAQFEKEHAVEGFSLASGLYNMAAIPQVIQVFKKYVARDHLTLETGGGQTTVALAALARHHISVNPDQRGIDLIGQYLDSIGLPRGKLTFIPEKSETGLARLATEEELDFAYVDGCHGYPFPAIDWHFIDLHLKVGGIMGFDNTELAAVRQHCEFLEGNGSYQLIETVTVPGFGNAKFYRKLKNEAREWVHQRFCTDHLPNFNEPARPPVAAVAASRFSLGRLRRLLRPAKRVALQIGLLKGRNV